MGASLSSWLSLARLSKTKQGYCRLLQVLAHSIKEVISPHVTTAFGIWRKEANPLWCVQLSTFVKGVCLSICPSPGRALSGFVEYAELRAACKGTPSNIQQGWWGTYLS